MNLKGLKKPQLLELARELGLQIAETRRKPEIIDEIEGLGANEEELRECLDAIELRKEELREEREREEQKRREEREERERMERHAIEMKRLEVELVKAQSSNGASAVAREKERRMTDLMPSYAVGGDMGLFLVHFERTCEREKFAKDTWPQRLLTLLPCEVADIIARMGKEDAEDYDRVKASLLKKYRLSAEAFRRKFREVEKFKDESYPEFAYTLKVNLEEWLREEGALGDAEKTLQCFALEQFFRRLPEEIRYWVQDRPGVDTITRAAELAEEYVTRRVVVGKEAPRKEMSKYRSDKPPRWAKSSQYRLKERSESTGGSDENARGKQEAPEKGAEGQQKKAFEAKRPIVCFRCQQTGHIALGCKNPKVVLMSLCSNDENLKLLEPYIRDLVVNGQPCRVLRDSAATMDVVHPSYVEESQFTGECAWIKQAVEANSACLPVARVRIEGPFGVLDTEAAVSAHLPAQYPYLFSNKSEDMLRQRGIGFSEGIVQALTRSKARELAAQTVCKHPVAEETAVAEPSLSSTKPESPVEAAENTLTKKRCRKQDEPGASREVECTRKLLGVSPATLIGEQKKDSTLRNLTPDAKEGVAKRNIQFIKRGGVLYRKYRSRKGVQFDQLVVPYPYRSELLHLVHGGLWSGHLGIRKTKDCLLREFYWPGCFREVEAFVRTCDTCQRIGKPGDKAKAPMKLVPIITEPFRRLVIDTVGPLPVTKSGYRHILTVLCPATKFPEAVPLKELSSEEIVKALLSIFARVGFPAEIQSDQGSVFTSALTSTFLEKCGVKIIHSSVYHPQSNAVEKVHSVMKRLLRALCHEHKGDWEACLPAAMFALRIAPHESTGFSPAELVYGRALRSPLRIIRESWEGREDDPSVVAYVLELLDRLYTAQELAGQEMRIAQSNAKRYYDKTARTRSFGVGDKVMILRPSPKNKLQVQWEGPVEVLQRLSDTNYLVAVPGRRKTQVYHSNLLKPYQQRQAIVNMSLNQPEEMPVDFPELTREKNDIHRTIGNLVEKAELKPDQKAELTELLFEFKDVFSDTPGRTKALVHDIELTSSEPVRSKAYRVSPRQREILAAEIGRMLELGVIEPGESDYTSPLILVEVPGKEPRPCIDYRRLNLITKDQTYPIPHIEERLERVSSANFISTLDLVRGYWQVPLTERASRLAAFISPMGTFRPKVLSFGLKNAPYCFSGLMDKVLQGMEDFALPYLDDIAIFSSSWVDHVKHLRAVLCRLREANLTVKAAKCQLGRAEVAYLGHVIGQGYRRPSEVKLAAIDNFPQPRTKRDIRSFLGLAGYYQRYIPRYSEIASPLTDALRKTEPQMVKWDEAKEHAFSTLKKALMSQPVLSAPDYSKPFILQCDASDRGMGVVLCQRGENDHEHPVLYASRKLSVREEAYSASEKECACVVWAVQKLACYIASSRFTIETDHCPLTWLQSMSSKNGRLLRWSLALQQYTFDIHYKKGRLNGNADGLSRCP